MSLLINIEDLLNKNKVESDRIEYKLGWNPDSVMRTICAFANDFANIGSGYILIGVEEINGIAKRPVKGINDDQLDSIQQELLRFCNSINPNYYPRVSVEKVDEKNILAIWIPAGDNRPYKVPDNVTAKHKTYNYRIRWTTSSIIPNKEQERELTELTANIPFDDRLNRNALIDDLDFSLMREHLSEIKSGLFEQSAKMNIAELAEKMNLVSGSNETQFPKNVGLLMFNKTPEKFFKSAYIDVVHHHNGLDGSQMDEITFNGPIQLQLKQVLKYFELNVIKSRTIKIKSIAKAKTIYNYPFTVLEEAIPNAVYHRDYNETEPIEIRVFPDKIEIISYSGVDSSLKQKDFDKGVIRARRYRNRRIGEFLKELGLTEGRGTGIPRMNNAMEANGSPKVTFDIDSPDRRYFITEIPINSKYQDKLKSKTTRLPSIEKVNSFNELTNKQKGVLKLIFVHTEITYQEMSKELGISISAIQKHTSALKEKGALKRVGTRNGYWKIIFTH